ncbi:hypothetical protein D3C86_1458700 [compost metagenome]
MLDLASVTAVARHWPLVVPRFKATIELSQQHHRATHLLGQFLETLGDRPIRQVIAFSLLRLHQGQIVHRNQSQLTQLAAQTATLPNNLGQAHTRLVGKVQLGVAQLGRYSIGLVDRLLVFRMTQLLPIYSDRLRDHHLEQLNTGHLQTETNNRQLFHQSSVVAQAGHHRRFTHFGARPNAHQRGLADPRRVEQLVEIVDPCRVTDHLVRVEVRAAIHLVTPLAHYI